MAPILEAHVLTKRFKTTEALAGLDLVAERGQVTAILGPMAPARPPSSAWSPPCSSPTQAA